MSDQSIEDKAALHGELSLQIRQLRDENKKLTEQISVGTKQLQELTDGVERLKAQRLKLKTEIETADSEKLAEIEAAAATVQKDQEVIESDKKELAQMKKDFQKVAEDHAVKADKLREREETLDTLELLLNSKEFELSQRETIVKGLELKQVEISKQLKKEARDNANDLKRIAKDQHNVEIQLKSAESIKESKKTEIIKLEEHHNKLRVDIQKNEALKKSIENRIPRLERLLVASDEVKKFILDNSGNPDAIINKINVTFDTLHTVE